MTRPRSKPDLAVACIVTGLQCEEISVAQSPYRISDVRTPLWQACKKKIADEPSRIPLVDVLRAANELVSAGLIKDYALGGALAAIYYTEPFTTYAADIIFVASDKTLSVGIPATYSHLQSKGWRVERKHLFIKDFPVQFLAASGLTEEAVQEATPIQYEGVPAKVFRPEYIIAIATSVGRPKDLARIEQLLEQAEIDKPILDDILRRYNLKLPTK